MTRRNYAVARVPRRKRRQLVRRPLVVQRRRRIRRAPVLVAVNPSRRRAPRRLRRNMNRATPIARRRQTSTAFETNSKMNNPRSGTYYKHVSMIGKLDPELCFALACLNPGTLVSPYVENGEVSALPIQILTGSFTEPVPVLVGDTTNLSMITCCPVGASVYNGGAPITFNYSNNPNTLVGVASMLSNRSMATAFGTTSYADKLGCWAAELNLELLVPAANMTGVIHVGSVSLSSVGVSISYADLKKRAQNRIDLKEGGGKVINLRAAVQNPQAIHSLFNTSDFSQITDEYISYAIFENVGFSITANTPTPYSIVVNVLAQAVWWPDGAQPALAGVAKAAQQNKSADPEQDNEEDWEDVEDPTDPAKGIKTRRTAKATEKVVEKSIAHENAITLRKMNNHALVPKNMETLVKACMGGVSVQPFCEMYDRTAGATNSSGGNQSSLKIESNPQIICPALEDDLDLIEWMSRRDATRCRFDNWTSEALDTYDQMCDYRDHLITLLTNQVKKRKEFEVKVFNSDQEVEWHRGRQTIRYKYHGEYLDFDFLKEIPELDEIEEDYEEEEKYSKSLSTVSVTNLPLPKLLKKKADKTPEKFPGVGIRLG